MNPFIQNVTTDKLPEPIVTWYSLVPEITHKSHYAHEKYKWSHKKFFADRKPNKKTADRKPNKKPNKKTAEQIEEIMKSIQEEYNSDDRLHVKILMDRYECNFSNTKLVIHNLIKKGVVISKTAKGYFMI